MFYFSYIHSNENFFPDSLPSIPPALAPLSILLDNLTCSFCFLISNACEHLHSVFLPPSPDHTTYPQIMELTETITFRIHRGQYSSSSFYHTSFVSTVISQDAMSCNYPPTTFPQLLFSESFSYLGSIKTQVNRKGI